MNLPLKFYKILVFGTIGGYFAGICAYLGMVCFVNFGFEVLVNTIKLTSVWSVLFVPCGSRRTDQARGQSKATDAYDVILHTETGPT